MPNSLSQVPKGSLLQADNTVVSYNGLLSVRPEELNSLVRSLATLTGIPTTGKVFQEFFYRGFKTDLVRRLHP